MSTPPTEPESTSPDDPFRAITEAALDLIEATGHADAATLAERFPGAEVEIRACLETLATYETKLMHGRQSRTRPTCAAAPGDLVGDFELVALLGQGGMGVVFHARQLTLGGRDVALKLLPSELVAKDPRFLERFRREVRLAAGLNAPGIARVFDSGTADGQPYFAMELVRGPSLAEVLRGLAALREAGDPGLQARAFVHGVARLGLDLATALGTLHQAGLVHRDVKPSNVILTPPDTATPPPAHPPAAERIQGRPVLVDFGLLRPIETSDLTRSRTLIGTPAFASPEASLAREVDARSDVFSLGVLLHDLLSCTATGGRQPATAGLPDIHKLNPAVDERLVAILDMCTQERPEVRYADGGELAAELKRYLADRPVRALPTNGWQRFNLWRRREPARAAQVVTGLAALTMLSVALLLGAMRVLDARATLTKAKRLEAQGELQAAGIAWQDVASEAPILRWLPGSEAGLERAEQVVQRLAAVREADFAGASIDPAMTLAEVYRHLLDNSRQAFRDAHDQVLMLLLTPGYEALRPTLFGFLARELADDRAPWRRQLAAMSAAQISVCAPLPLPPGESLPPPERKLADALLAMAATPVDVSTLQYAVSALSGMASDRVLEELLALELPLDPELQRLFMRTFRRAHFARRAQGWGLPVRLLVQWTQVGNATVLDPQTYADDPLPEAANDGGQINAPPPPSQIEFSVMDAMLSVAEELDQLTHGGNHYGTPPLDLDTEAAAARARALREAMAWTEESRLARTLWQDSQAVIRQALTSDSVHQWHSVYDLLLQEPALAGISREAIARHLKVSDTVSDQSLAKVRKYIGSDRNFLYKNIWDQADHEAGYTLSAAPEASHTGGFSFDANGPRLFGNASHLWARGGTLISDTPRWDWTLPWCTPILRRVLARVPALGRERSAELLKPLERTQHIVDTETRRWLLELRQPRRASVEVTFDLPPKPLRGSLTIGHNSAGRAILPYNGIASVDITINGRTKINFAELGPRSTDYSNAGDGWWLRSDIRLNTIDCVGMDQLTVRYELSDGTNLTWLNYMQLEIETVDD